VDVVGGGQVARILIVEGGDEVLVSDLGGSVESGSSVDL
jgi:hypothetical protein